MESGLLETELLSETPENTLEGGGGGRVSGRKEGRKENSFMISAKNPLPLTTFPFSPFSSCLQFLLKIFVFLPSPPSFIIVDPGTTVLLVAPLQWLPACLEKKPRETKLFLSSLNLNTKNTAQGAESITEGGGYFLFHFRFKNTRFITILKSRKELSLCHKLWLSNPYIFATQCRRP